MRYINLRFTYLLTLLTIFLRHTVAVQADREREREGERERETAIQKFCSIFRAGIALRGKMLEQK